MKIVGVHDGDVPVEGINVGTLITVDMLKSWIKPTIQKFREKYGYTDADAQFANIANQKIMAASQP